MISIEPHKELLKQPSGSQLLYKIISVENLIASISNSYLYFNRVDGYIDFINADNHDGEQLPKDRHGNTASKFLKAPNFSAADSYDLSRKRTYACCFSLENSDYIWNSYGQNNTKGKAGIVFEFGKLRSMLNEILKTTIIKYNSFICSQIFFINYGIVEYVERENYQANTKNLPNPIKYTYIKDKEKFQKEKELRISLSTLPIGRFTLNDGNKIVFPAHLQLSFDFRTAIANGALREILHAPDCDFTFLMTELQKLGFYKY